MKTTVHAAPITVLSFVQVGFLKLNFSCQGKPAASSHQNIIRSIHFPDTSPKLSPLGTDLMFTQSLGGGGQTFKGGADLPEQLQYQEFTKLS